MPEPDPTNPGLRWAAIMKSDSDPARVSAIIEAVNAATTASQATIGDVVSACAQILGQTIPHGGMSAAPMREGIMSMIDGFAMQVAVERD